MEKVRVGVVGLGWIFLEAHLKAYAELNEAKLVALCDFDEANLKRGERATKRAMERRVRALEDSGDEDIAREVRNDIEGLRLYSDYRELLDKERIDLIDICTPPNSHSFIAIDALRRGLNVMAEKPMDSSWLDCIEVLEAVKESGKLYQHNENWIYEPLWYNARKIIDSGAIGEVVLMFLATAHSGPEFSSWFWTPEIGGGGALLDNGIHALTTSWFLVGFDRKPVRIKAAEPYGLATRMKKRIIAGRYQDVAVEDDAHILVEFEDPESGAWATSHVEGSWSWRDSRETIIIGTNGSIEFIHEEGKSALKITDSFDNTRIIEVQGPSGFYRGFYGEIRNMCNCVVTGIKPICDELIGAEAQAMVGAAYLSQARGRRSVTLDEFKEFAMDIKKREKKNASQVLIGELIAGLRK